MQIYSFKYYLYADGSQMYVSSPDLFQTQGSKSFLNQNYLELLHTKILHFFLHPPQASTCHQVQVKSAL